MSHTADNVQVQRFRETIHELTDDEVLLLIRVIISYAESGGHPKSEIDLLLDKIRVRQGG